MLVGSCRRKEKKNVNFVNLINFFIFLIRFLFAKYMIGGQFQGMSKEKIKKKLNCHRFFSCRTSFQHIGELVNRRVWPQFTLQTSIKYLYMFPVFSCFSFKHQQTGVPNKLQTQAYPYQASTAVQNRNLTQVSFWEKYH